MDAFPFGVGTRILVRKLASSENPVALPASWEEFEPGKLQKLSSLPISYEVVGILLRPVVAGHPIYVARSHRNGINIPGLFWTSPVQTILGHFVTTRNSMYHLIPFPAVTD